MKRQKQFIFDGDFYFRPKKSRQLGNVSDKFGCKYYFMLAKKRQQLLIGLDLDGDSWQLVVIIVGFGERNGLQLALLWTGRDSGAMNWATLVWCFGGE